MNTPERYEIYLKRFLTESIQPLPSLTFPAPEDYEFSLFGIFQGWRILKGHPDFYTTRFKKLAALIEMIDQFDDSLERPLNKREIQTLHFNSQWRPIQDKARIIGSTF